METIAVNDDKKARMSEIFGQVFYYDDDINKMFNKKNYQPSFDKLYEMIEPALEILNGLYISSDEKEKEQLIKDAAASIVGGAVKKHQSFKKSEATKGKYGDHIYMSLFVVPAVGHYQGEAADKLADALVERWREVYTKYTITRGSYEAISEGFNKRKFCYITTAVCRQRNLPDDCYELMTLRYFRDFWLEKQKDGPKLIDMYYETAPAIVASIDHRADADLVYSNLYHTYIAPCITDIENGNYDECRDKYEHMVTDLISSL